MKNLQSSSDNQLELLKKLLLEDELKQLKQLVSKLNKLEIESNDIESIKQKIEPVFDDVLLDKLSTKDSKTIEILAIYLSDIIKKSTKQDITKLSNALKEIISPAISSEIENNKDKMIDALYPIMGGMISKYVTQSIKELMESINQKIEDGLSFDSYKRKIKSKITGVSEVELLLEESSDASISSLLIVHKETGLLIAEAHDEDAKIDDASMVASMASAIKDFVNDWIQSQEDELASEVQILSYGNATLYIESAGSVYMIAFMESEPDYEQRKQIHNFFAKLVSAHSSLFQNFDGDMSDKDISKVEDELYQFLKQNEHKKSVSKTNSPNIAKYILYIVFIISISYIGNEAYSRYRLSILADKIKDISKVDVKLKSIGSSTIEVDGYIKDINQYYMVEDILKSENYTNIINKLSIPIAKIYKQISSNNVATAQLISTQLNNKLQAENSLLIQELKQLKQDISKDKKAIEFLVNKSEIIVHLTNIKRYILKDLANVFKTNPYYYSDGSLDFHIKNLFKPNETMYDKGKIKQIEKNYDKYISVLFSKNIRKKVIKSIIIEGYTDSSGNYEKNLKLSSKRAENIKNYLISLPISKKYNIKDIIYSKGMGNANPVLIDGVEDKSASRRIKIRFELNDSKILDEINKVQP